MKRKRQKSNLFGNEKQYGLLIYLLLLTAIFLLIELSLFIQNNVVYLDEFKYISNQFSIPRKVIPGILFFVGVQLVLHILFTLGIWIQTLLIRSGLHWRWKTVEKLGFGLWFTSLFAVLIANQYYFPNSISADLTQLIIPQGLAGFLLVVLSIMLSLALFIALYGLVRLRPKSCLIVALFGVVAAATFFYSSSHGVTRDGATLDKPNIILIGIDSLRPDYLGFFEKQNKTPNIDRFLEKSTVFADALTPIARTFPAWVSILTGQYPKHNGIRTNLSTTPNFDWHSTLPSILQAQGYTTIFSTDETRFSNINERFGFDQIVTPPVGFNDFLLGTMNDFPLGNLLVNSVFGQYLFANSYANRGAAVLYEPNSFLKMLRPALAKSRDKPLFLAVHFCLPHFPYFWSAKSVDDSPKRNYQNTVERADQQFEDFLALLKQYHVLDHSMVILLSDHGEAIKLPGDRSTQAELYVPGASNPQKIIPHFYPSAAKDETVNTSVGHGTDILSLTQSHVVLAFQTLGLRMDNQTITIPGRVSLLDIKPTVLTLLGIPPAGLNDGVSLLGLVWAQKSAGIPDTDFFMETDFSPQAILSVHPNMSKVILEGFNLFEVDPVTARLTVKEEMAKMIISSKQYADVYGDWILALYPHSQKKFTPILLNMRSGMWTDDLNTSFAKTAPVSHMMKALQDFYGKDI